tara:strand:+ start:2678 stop:3724 length:1047 start_codon:yes stop_codon:yes gene_type:complete
MNSRQFNEKTKVDPHFHRKCFWTNVNNVNISEEDDQIRDGGIVDSHVSDLASQIFMDGQKIPITVESDGNGGWNAVDGSHRIGGVKLNDKAHPGEGYDQIFVYEEKFSSEAERVLYQKDSNEHLVAKKNHVNDAVASIRKLMEMKNDPNVPDVLQRDISTETDPKCYMKDLEAWIKDNYSFTSREYKSILKKVTSDYTNSKVKNYTKPGLVEEFSTNNTIGWVGGKAGDESNGYVLYPVNQASHIFPNITGNSYKKKTKNKNIQSVVVLWEGNTVGKEGCHIDDYRRKLVESINEVNQSHLLKRGMKLVDKVFLAPQKIGDVKENLNSFYEVPYNNGSFSVNLPRKGW